MAQSHQVGSRFLDLGVKQEGICLGAEEEEENRCYQKSLVSSALSSDKPALRSKREASSPRQGARARGRLLGRDRLERGLGGITALGWEQGVG